MKRSDDGRAIKIPDPNAMAGATGLNLSNVTSITPVYPVVGNLSLQQTAGVTVYRRDPVPPPAAHSGLVITATSLQQPSSTGNHQPGSSVKHESINLPTAPISLHYANSYSGGSGPNSSMNSGPPASVKTLANSMPGSLDTSVQSIVQNLQHQRQQQQQQVAPNAHQVVHPKPVKPQNVTTVSRPISSFTPTGADNNTGVGPGGVGSASFQRLKVEDALSYLDQVKYKFGNQPQVYNDFLDIMKEFKSQSIDTPGVIGRVSSLFRGHPELIVGFNTFLPPGYKIEVHSNDSIAVSMPGAMPGTTVQTIVHTPHGIHKMTTHGSGPLTSITTTNTGLVQPMQQQHLSQAPPLSKQQQQGNVIRMSLPSIPSAPSLTSTPLCAPKPHPPPRRRLQLGIKTESSNSSSGYHSAQAGHLASIQGSAMIPMPNAAAQAVAQVRQQMQQQAPTGPTSGAGGGSQPVEFNHAINYVNKIKNRFQGQPDVYKQFLEILHSYQKDQKAIKEGQRPTGPYLTEAEVYAKVAKLFRNQEDLLSEFGQFLPEATGENSMMMGKGLSNDHLSGTDNQTNNFKYGINGPGAPGPGSGLPISSIKRPASGPVHPPAKKMKRGFLGDVSLGEAGKFGTLNEYAFFDKVRKALKSTEVYNNFLRCLILFNQEVISRGELIQLTTPLLGRHSELFKWFKDFVGHQEGVNNSSSPPGPSADLEVNPAGPDKARGRNDNREWDAETAVEIDYSTCKRLGASYCALPKNFVQPSCSGRTHLCREVLNDTWVSFPSWSEDSQFVTSRKTQYEESIYRTEDERFEFDVVLETTRDTIKVLECVQKKMSRMPPEEAARYHLDDCLGGTSSTLHQKVIRRIYGEKWTDIVEGLKRNPVVAVPLVLRRLRAKDEEWRAAQKRFNKIWREQNDKYYLKSLDHQSLLFKQTDAKNLRSKSLLGELETLYDERHEQIEANENRTPSSQSKVVTQEGPHLTLTYQDFSILEDANNLLIHHVKRQTSISKEDKQKIKMTLKHFLMDAFKHPRQDLSDDEREDDDDNDEDSSKDEEGEDESESGERTSRSERTRKKRSRDDESHGDQNGSPVKISSEENEAENERKQAVEDITEADIKIEPRDGRHTPLHARDMDPAESYTLFMANNNWYLFLRLHLILCERLAKMYNQAAVVASEETADRKDRKESTAVALKLKPKSEVEPEDYYPTFLEMVKNLLDGNTDSQTYEDSLREMFGIHAYVSFTLDKVIGNAVRQLQHLVSDESCVECYDLFISESKSNGTGGMCSSAAERQIPELIYQKKAEKLLSDENCMKIVLYHQKGDLTVELLDTETDDGHDSEDERSRRIQSYASRFVGPDDDIFEECLNHLALKPIFLPRSVRSFNKRSRARTSQNKSDASKMSPDSDAITPESDRASMKQENDSTDSGANDEGSPCRFNLNDHKILFIINSENCFYRKMSLSKALKSHKSVSLAKTGSFSRWHAGWVRQNVPESSHNTTEKWFLGQCEELLANRTIKLTTADLEKTPYRVYHRYSVEVLKPNLDDSDVTSSP